MRHFLFLQGGVGPLFSRLGAHLDRSGHAVSRLNFCMGDCLVWRQSGGIAFRESLGVLPERLEVICRQRQVTDLLLFGGCRPVHRPALARARVMGLRAYVVEEGYLRPNWITIEPGGVNADSALPRDPDWYRRVAPGLPRLPEGVRVPRVPIAVMARMKPSALVDALVPVDEVTRVQEADRVDASADLKLGHDLAARALRGGAYQLARLADPWAFPHYRGHRVDHPLAEAAGWLRRFSALRLHRRRDRARIEPLLRRGGRFFLLPLQLRGDAQVVYYSRFAGMLELIDQVIESFAQHAPADTQLLIKNHPLDSGLQDYACHVRRMATAAGIVKRVHYIETGELSRLLEAATGLVTINSTCGLAALMQRCPTIALGRAIYDLPGLTFQGPLDRFWQTPEPPDLALTDAFSRVLIYTSQLRGNLYTRSGIQLAVRGIDRFLTERSPLETLLDRCQPAHAGDVVGPSWPDRIRD